MSVKTTIKTLFWRPVNLARGRATRASSPYTSFKGLGKIWRKATLLRGLVSRNIEERIQSERISIQELVRIAVEEVPELQKAISLRLIKQFDKHAEIVDALAPHLESTIYRKSRKQIGVKPISMPGLGAGARGERAIYDVTAIYVVREWAQDALRGIYGLSTDQQLNEKIIDLLNNAPLLKEYIGKEFGPAEYHDWQTDHDDWY
jgi:hypothetical protein